MIVSITLAGLLSSTVLRGFHASLLGFAFGPIDTILTGTGLLVVLAGLYTRVNLRAMRGVGTQERAQIEAFAVRWLVRRKTAC